MRKLSERVLTVILTISMLLPMATSGVVANAETSIPSDAVVFNGHAYKVYSNSLSWYDAKAYCENLDGHLVTITSEAEQAFLNELVAGVEKRNVWIGAYIDDEAKWVTDEEFSLYENWATGEPNNVFNMQDSVMMYTTCADFPVGTWNDENGNGRDWEGYYLSDFGFICEWEKQYGDKEYPGLKDQNEYCIYGRKFDANIDYYAAHWNSSDYNATLANMLAALSAAVYSKSDIESAYSSLGFSDVGVYDYDGEFSPDRCGYSMAYKKSDYGDETIFLISVRGSSNTSDWIGNVALATFEDEKHIGFAYPANHIYDNIQKTIESDKITGKIKYVITGHSRGAAVANLLAVKLMENGTAASDVYDYNFACPDVACKVIFPAYINIFNLCNREDPVPFVPGDIASALTTPGSSWGKFGKTYWFTKDDPDTISPFADHSIDLYLDFFDQQLNPSDWGATFSDVLDDVANWISGWITKVLCPVDVIITDAEENRIASVIDGKINYYDSTFGDVIILTDGDKKVIYINGDKDFDVELIGTDNGEMTYSIEQYSLLKAEVTESKTFSHVSLEKGKVMYSPVSDYAVIDDVELYVVKSENEKDVITSIIETDGRENEVKHECDHCDDNHDGVCDDCGEDFTQDCGCKCHSQSKFRRFLYRIARFFCKLFRIESRHYCDCGKAHW